MLRWLPGFYYVEMESARLVLWPAAPLSGWRWGRLLSDAATAAWQHRAETALGNRDTASCAIAASLAPP
jgi:hypothetical protein